MWKLTILFATFASFALWGDQDNSRLNWLTNYSEAVEQSRSTSKPILLFFTGSDWCGWCHKLEKEVLNTSEFAEKAGNQFIFVTIDFPLYKPADPKVAEQNKNLQKKYDVKGFPTLVIIDKNEQTIGTTGYRPGGAHSYADYLLKMVGDYGQYRGKLTDSKTNTLSSSDLKSLFHKANELGRQEDAARLISLGIASDEKGFFLLERYRTLAFEGEIHSAEALAIKKEIQSYDPNNDKETLYQLALIEFEALSEEMSKESYSPDVAVQPLLQYIQKFGKTDKENVWKLQMVMTQYFLDKNRLPQALDHAQASLDLAPDPVKSDIATTVKNIRTTIKK